MAERCNVRGGRRLAGAALAAAILSFVPPAGAATIYVTANGTDSLGASWATPTSLTNALAIAVSNDLVLVSNGVYTVTNALSITNGFTVQGFSTRDATVLARNGAGPNTRVISMSHASAKVDSLTVSNGYTTVEGAGFYMTAGTITNVVVTHCRAYNLWNDSGGGVYMTGGTVVDSEIKRCDANGTYSSGGSAICMSAGEVRNVTMHNNGLLDNATKGTVRISGGTLRSCIVTNNRGYGTAGIYMSGSALVHNCLVASNADTHATDGVGGVRQGGGRLVHVTVADNTCSGSGNAGGIYVTSGTITNCIAWGNRLGGLVSDIPVNGNTLARYSTASELTVTNGNKNNDPLFTTVGGVPYHLAPASPCVDAGTNLAGIAYDLAGTNRVIDGNGDTVAITDMGCREAPEMAPGTLAVSIETLSATAGIAPLDVVLKANPAGDNTTITWYGWDLDGDGDPELTGAGRGQITNAFGPGSHTIRLWVTNSAPTGASTVSTNLVNLVGSNIYVSASGTHESPFDTLGKGATNLQAALDLALAGCSVIVDAGVYDLPKEYKFAKQLTLRGIGARTNTIIADPVVGGTYRPFWLAHASAMVHSLTVSNWVNNQYGNTFLLDAGLISNVVVTHCGDGGSGWNHAGGAKLTGGTLVDSEIKYCNNKGNYDQGGSAIYMTGGEVRNVTMHDNGFGTDSYKGTVHISGGTLRRCSIINNRGYGTAGIYISGGTPLVENCLVADNADTHATAGVGGVRQAGGRLVNVTVAHNTCSGTGNAGGVYRTAGVITNSIIWGNALNAAPSNYAGAASAVWYSCAPELTNGVQGNKSSDPAFADVTADDYTLTIPSPTRNAGMNLNWTANDLDLAGGARLFGGFVDMGAYEFSVPLAAGGAPTMVNLAATDVAAAGATLNGWLVDTGAAACAVGVLWGTSDGGTNASAWANTNWFNGGAVNPAYVSDTLFATNISMGANQIYYYAYVASNASGVTVASPSETLIIAEITLRATDANASFVAGDTGVFTVSRAAAVTNADLLVNYAVGGTAVEGTDYSNIIDSVTIPTGATNATITIRPIENPPMGASVNVELTLAAGGYAVGNPSNGTVTITKLGDTIYVTTNGSGSGASWATPTSLTNGIAIAGAYDTVLVSNGLYTVTNTLYITNTMSLRGFATRDDTVIARAGAGNVRLFNLSHASAFVHTLTASNAYTALSDEAGHGAGFNMTAGTVSNVVVTHCNAANGWNIGGGVYMTGGKVLDSVIKNCDNNGQWYAGGSAVYMSAGLVSNVLMRNNGEISSVKGTAVIQGGSMRSCIITNNRGGYVAGATLSGAGSLLENCLIAGNTATDAGNGVGGLKMSGGRAVHVTVASNTAPLYAVAGGVSVTGGRITNSIAWGNLLGGAVNNLLGGDAYARYTAASELAITNGNKNSDPLFTTLNGTPYGLASASPCVDAGTTLAGIACDLAGTNRVIDGNGDTVAVADMGCYEAPNPVPGTLAVGIESLTAVSGLAPLDVVLKATPAGDNTTITWYGWDLDNDGVPERTGAGLVQITNTYNAGAHTVRLWVTNSALAGASAVAANLVNMVGSNVYVSAGGSHESPYHTLAKAATNLQAALDVALAGCAVVVDTGTYSLNSQYQFNKKLTLRGIGTREATVITRGASDTRLFQLANADAMIHSLTVSNGYTQADGAGFYMTAGTISNVVVTHCHAYNQWCSGGGGYMTGGKVVDSVIKNCDNKDTYSGYPGGSAVWMTGGALSNVLMHSNGRVGSTRGTAVISGGSMSRCIVTNNSGVEIAGVTLSGAATLIENCLIASNTASSGVGGLKMSAGRAVHVTVASNAAPGGGTAGGVYQTGGVVTNSVMWGNMLGAVAGGYSGTVSAVWYSCAPELTTGVQGNTANNPLFEGNGDYHLRAGSPCIDTSLDLPGIATDQAGATRIFGNHADMGAYETVFSGGSMFLFR